MYFNELGDNPFNSLKYQRPEAPQRRFTRDEVEFEPWYPVPDIRFVDEMPYIIYKNKAYRLFPQEQSSTNEDDIVSALNGWDGELAQMYCWACVKLNVPISYVKIDGVMRPLVPSFPIEEVFKEIVQM